MQQKPAYNYPERLVKIFFYVLLALHLVPLLFGKYLPAQDGPSHLKNAWMLKEMLLHHDSQFWQYFSINNIPNPNWLLHIIYAGLMMIVPPFMAEKLFLAAYIIFFPLSFRYLVRQLKPENSFISLLIFPLLYNITFAYGFFNFCLSMVFYFYAVGYWLNKRGVFGFRQNLVLLLWVTLTFFSHPVSFFLEGFTFAFLWVGYAIEDWRHKLSFLYSFKRLTGIMAAFLPSLLCFLLFLQKNGSDIGFEDVDPYTYIKDQILNRSLSALDNADLVPYAMLTFILAAGLVWYFISSGRRQGLAGNGMLLLQFVLFGVGIAFAPSDFANGSFIFIRLALYSNVFAIMVVAMAVYQPKVQKWASIFFSIYALYFICLHTWQFWLAQKGLSEYLSIETRIPEGKVFYPLAVTKTGSVPGGGVLKGDPDVFLHASGYVSIERKALSLENYEATFGYFPLQWKPQYNTAKLPEGGDTLTNSVMESYKKQSGIYPDYILLWGEPDSLQRAYKLKKELEVQYRFMCQSKSGYAWLYEQRR